METNWERKVTEADMLKKLVKFRKEGYNHVTMLWWEPFIQGVFWFALRVAKKLGYTTLVTTNATTLHIDEQAKKFLPYIDQLLLSVEAIDADEQQRISRTKVVVQWEDVFKNIEKYWKGNYFKANIVITQDNKNSLLDMVKFVHEHGMFDVAITYPDIYMTYYKEEHIKERVAPRYDECMDEIVRVYEYCQKHGIQLKVVDFPFCVFPKDKTEEYTKITDDIDFWNRLKIADTYRKDEDKYYGELDRSQELPRARRTVKVCKTCKYNKICWWPSVHYESMYWLDEIQPII